MSSEEPMNGTDYSTSQGKERWAYFYHVLIKHSTLHYTIFYHIFKHEGKTAV